MKGKQRVSRVAVFFSALFVILLFYQFTPYEGLRLFARPGEETIDPAFLHVSEQWADSVLNSLSMDERIAQMIMIAAYSNNNDKNEQEVVKAIRSHNIGGLIFFQGSPYRQAVLTNAYQELAKTPMLIAMDAEWGLGMRLDSTISYPRQMMLGAIKDEKIIYDMGRQVAGQLSRLGVHINFAPVADINNNASNPVINSRSFGEDRGNVTSKAILYMRGMQENGIIAVAKHFPGHGDTDVDSHYDLPVIKHGIVRLDSLEFFPFRELINKGVAGFMIAHMYMPALDSTPDIPSSLSPVIVDTLLKQNLGFKGLIFTDAMSMQGITDFHKPEEAVELAVTAGNDILVMPGDVQVAVNAVSRMLRRGLITEEEVNARCKKILLAKYWCGLANYAPIDMESLYTDLHREKYQLLRRQLIETSVTLIENRNDIIPFRRLDTLNISSLSFGATNDSSFQKSLSLYAQVRHYFVPGEKTGNRELINIAADNGNILIVSVHSNDIRATRNYGIPDEVIKVVDSLAVRKRVVLCVFGNPYLLNRFSNPAAFESVILSYENSSAVQEITAQMLFGAIGIKGMMPVSAGPWKYREGYEIEPLGRLKYSLPLEAGMDSDTLKMIDAIIAAAIDTQAMPGCQVLVARKGIVVLNKAYGKFTYDGDQKVNTGDLYDIASLTKVCATTPMIMKLTEQGKIDINGKLADYLPYLVNTNKKDILIRDVMMHQARLQAWIPFYYSLLEPLFKGQSLFTTTISASNPYRLAAEQYVNRYTGFKQGTASTVYSFEYPVQVARGIYLKKDIIDTVYRNIANSPLRDKNEYLYSDLGFYLFSMMMDTITGESLDLLASKEYYSKLGAYRLCYHPLERYDINEIVPTENDQFYRKQVLQGYVHDQGAALIGGVSGHAGLFSNANDLAKLFQMYLNGGEYGGERYLEAKTIEQFTRGGQGVEKNRRALGFDKPEPDTTKSGPSCLSASPVSYGHSGFTGTMAWNDPQYELVYIFLSNRVYPDANNNRLSEMNIRTNVQQVIYNAIIDK